MITSAETLARDHVFRRLSAQNGLPLSQLGGIASGMVANPEVGRKLANLDALPRCLLERLLAGENGDQIGIRMTMHVFADYVVQAVLAFGTQ